MGIGIEAPEMADQLQKERQYSPLPSHDIWAFGLLLMRLLGGKRPEAHVQAAMSGQMLALAYAQSLCDPETPDCYMSEVLCTACLLVHPSLCVVSVLASDGP